MKVFIVSVCALVAGASCASADIIGDALHISASSGAASATWSLPITAGTWANDHSSWSWTAPAGWSYDFRSGDSSLGSLVSSADAPFMVRFDTDPVVTVNFTAVAGGATTLFTISSGLLAYATINPAQATASAGVTVTDRNGDGATLTGAYGDGSAYKADYNGLVPGGTNFASFNLNAVAPAFLTAIAGGNTGPFAPIGASSSQSAEFNFTLTALDLASGTSAFSVVPTPGVLGLAGIAGVAMARRRRA